jgi:hypothetical protein
MRLRLIAVVARTLSLPLTFLDPGKQYVTEIYRDGDARTIATSTVSTW